jgi:hypothetical protein
VSLALLQAGSVYDHADYVAASAAHVGADVEVAASDGVVLPLLRYPDGSRRTVYGLPRPAGASAPAALGALADAVIESGGRLVATLSPLEPGPSFAALLEERGARRVGERGICIADLGGEDPQDRFHPRARRAIRTARNRGARTEIGPLTGWFGAFYRAAMRKLSAESIYFFGEEYFHALGAVPHYQVTVEDAHGVAAAALFLHDDVEAYYHLGGRCVDAEPVVGAMSLALGEGVREAWRRGCKLAVLGGGRTDASDDPLFTFKRQLATSPRPRPTMEVGAQEIR